MIKAKAIGLSAVALVILFTTMHLQKMALKRELEHALNRVTVAEARLAAANANVTLSNATIDRQNTLISALENRIAVSRTLAETQIEEITRLSEEKRAAVKEVSAEETIDVIRYHLTEFFND